MAYTSRKVKTDGVKVLKRTGINVIIKEKFVEAVWVKIKESECQVMEAIIEVAEKMSLDMDSVARIIMYNSGLKTLLEQQSAELRLLKRPK